METLEKNYNQYVEQSIILLIELYGNDYQEIINSLDNYDIDDYIKDWAIEHIKEEYKEVVNDLEYIMYKDDTFNSKIIENTYFINDGVMINDQYGNDTYWSSVEDYAMCMTGSSKENRELIENLLYGKITLENESVDYIECDGEYTEASCSSDDFEEYKDIVENFNDEVEPYIEGIKKELEAYFLDKMLASGSGKKQSRGKI